MVGSTPTTTSCLSVSEVRAVKHDKDRRRPVGRSITTPDYIFDHQAPEDAGSGTRSRWMRPTRSGSRSGTRSGRPTRPPSRRSTALLASRLPWMTKSMIAELHYSHHDRRAACQPARTPTRPAVHGQLQAARARQELPAGGCWRGTGYIKLQAVRWRARQPHSRSSSASWRKNSTAAMAKMQSEATRTPESGGQRR